MDLSYVATSRGTCQCRNMDSCAKRACLKLSIDRPYIGSYYTSTETNGAKFTYQPYYLYVLLVLHSMESFAKRACLKLSMDRPQVGSYYTSK